MRVNKMARDWEQEYKDFLKDLEEYESGNEKQSPFVRYYAYYNCKRVMERGRPLDARVGYPIVSFKTKIPRDAFVDYERDEWNIGSKGLRGYDLQEYYHRYTLEDMYKKLEWYNSYKHIMDNVVPKYIEKTRKRLLRNIKRYAK